MKIKNEYGDDLTCVDTTHYACKHMLKTGPLKTADCFGYTAPIGLLQVPEEDGVSLDELFTILNINNSRTSVRTDAGSGWHYPIEELRGMVRTEDPHHLHRNAVEISGKCNNPSKFVDEVGDALYSFPMNTEGLDKHLEQMLVDGQLHCNSTEQYLP